MARRGKREGSIYQRSDGRWAAAIDLGYQNARRIRKTVYGSTRKDVAARLHVALGKVERGALVNTDDRVTVGEHLTSWLNTVSVRPRTLRQYEQVVRLYLMPAIGRIRLTQLQPGDVRSMTTALEARGLSARTATLARDVLRIALAQAVTDELAARNVAELVRRPAQTHRQLRALSTTEAQVLLQALDGHRLEGVVTCGVALGLRLGEALGLQWKNIDLSRGRIEVLQALHTTGKVRALAPLKSKESRRVLALPDVVVRSLERHKVAQAERRLAAGQDWERSDFVFTTRTGRPMDGTLVTRDLKTILGRLWSGGDPACSHKRNREQDCLDCGATRLPMLSFHGLRHSCASLLLAAGAPVRDVSELLGHSDVKLTLSTYAHVLDEGRARMASAMDSVFDSQSDSQTARRTRK